MELIGCSLSLTYLRPGGEQTTDGTGESESETEGRHPTPQCIELIRQVFAALVEASQATDPHCAQDRYNFALVKKHSKAFGLPDELMLHVAEWLKPPPVLDSAGSLAWMNLLRPRFKDSILSPFFPAGIYTEGYFMHRAYALLFSDDTVAVNHFFLVCQTILPAFLSAGLCLPPLHHLPHPLGLCSRFPHQPGLSLFHALRAHILQTDMMKRNHKEVFHSDTKVGSDLIPESDLIAEGQSNLTPEGWSDLTLRSFNPRVVVLVLAVVVMSCLVCFLCNV